MGKILHQELSYEIIGCAQRVHGKLGPGFPEAVYHRALCFELIDAKTPFESEKPFQVFYGSKLCGEFRADLVVDEKIVLELKALSELTSEHLAQALSYLKASGLHLAILINFGQETLQYKRVVL